MASISQLRKQRRELNRKFNAFINQSGIIQKLPNDIIMVIKDYVYGEIKNFKDARFESPRWVFQHSMAKSWTGNDTFFPRYYSQNVNGYYIRDKFRPMYSQMGVVGSLTDFKIGKSRIRKIRNQCKNLEILRGDTDNLFIHNKQKRKSVSLRKLMAKHGNNLELALNGY